MLTTMTHSMRSFLLRSSAAVSAISLLQWRSYSSKILAITDQTSDQEQDAADRVRPNATVMAAGLTIKGDLVSKCEVQFDGRLIGNLVGDQVIIGPSGSIEGKVRAESVVISGRFEGEITARHVTLTATCNAGGVINVTETLTVESGAFFDGHINRMMGRKMRNGRTRQVTVVRAARPAKPKLALVA